jgi:hypothetical protein
MTSGAPQKPDNPLVNLLVNIAIPVMILNKGAKWMAKLFPTSEQIDPRLILVIALAFPLLYGIQDYIRRRHKNYVSLLGLANIGLTGGLALAELGGGWFALKEASLPLLIGIFVLFSAWSVNPAARLMFCNPQILNMDLIDRRLAEFGRTQQFLDLLKRTTLWLSGSFFISATLNLILALRIFKNIDTGLAPEAHRAVLNEQIAKMTSMGYVVIALPLMFFSAILIYIFLNKLSKMTETPIDSLMKT